jgi:hypothetical protein
MSEPSNMGVEIGIKQLKVGETYVLSSDVNVSGPPEYKYIRVKRADTLPDEFAPGYYVIDMDVLNDDLTTIKEAHTIIANPSEKRPIHIFHKLNSTSGGKSRKNKRSKRTRSRRNR